MDPRTTVPPNAPMVQAWLEKLPYTGRNVRRCRELVVDQPITGFVQNVPLKQWTSSFMLRMNVPPFMVEMACLDVHGVGIATMSDYRIEARGRHTVILMCDHTEWLPELDAPVLHVARTYLTRSREHYFRWHELNDDEQDRTQ